MFWVNVWSCMYVHMYAYVCTSVWLYFNIVSLAMYYVYNGFFEGVFSRFLWSEFHLWNFSLWNFNKCKKEYKCKNEYKCSNYLQKFPMNNDTIRHSRNPPQNKPLHSSAYFYMTIILCSIKFNNTVFGKRIITAQDTWHIWWYRDYVYWNNAICYVKVNFIHSYMSIIWLGNLVKNFRQFTVFHQLATVVTISTYLFSGS